MSRVPKDKLDRLGTSEQNDNPESALMKYRKLLCISALQHLDLQTAAVTDPEQLQVTIKCFHHCLKEFPSMFAFREPASEDSPPKHPDSHLTVQEHHTLSLAFTRWSVRILLHFLSCSVSNASHTDVQGLITAILGLLKTRDATYFSLILEEIIDLVAALQTYVYDDSRNQQPACKMESENVPDVSYKLLHLTDEERLEFQKLPSFFFNDFQRCDALQIRIMEILCSLSSEISSYLHISCRMRYWTLLCIQVETGIKSLKKVSLDAVTKLVESEGVPMNENIVCSMLVHLETLMTMHCTGGAALHMADIAEKSYAVDLEESLANCSMAFLKRCLSTIDVHVFNAGLINTVLECMTGTLLQFKVSQIQKKELKEAALQMVQLLLQLLSHCNYFCQPFLQEQLFYAVFALLGDTEYLQGLVQLLVYLFRKSFQGNSIETNHTDAQEVLTRNAAKRTAEGTVLMSSISEDNQFDVKLELLKKTASKISREMKSYKDLELLHKLNGIKMSVEVLLQCGVMCETLKEKCKFKVKEETGGISNSMFFPATLLSQIVESCREVAFGQFISPQAFFCIMDIFSLLLKAQDLLHLPLPVLNDLCTLASAPWVAFVDSNDYHDLKCLTLPDAVRARWRKLASGGKESSLCVLAHLPAAVAPFWRLNVLATAVTGPSENIQIAVLKNLPVFVHMLGLTTEKPLQGFLSSLRTNSNIAVQSFLSAVLGPLHCVMSGNSNLQRFSSNVETEEYTSSSCVLKCKVCDGEENSEKRHPGWLQDMLLEYLSHHSSQVRKDAVKSCKFMFAHTRVTMDILLPFLRVIDDADYDVRMDFSDAVKDLLKHRGQSWTDNMSDTLAMQIRQATVKAQLCGDTNHLKTLLYTVRHLGQADCEELLNCALFSFLEYLQLSSPVLNAIASIEIKKLAVSKNMKVHRFFRLHWQTICKYVVQDMLEDKNQDPLILSYKITNLCDYSNIKVFLLNTMRFILPAVVSSQSPKTSVLLKALAEATQQSKRDLLTKNFPYIFSDLVRHCSKDVTVSTLNLIQKEAEYEIGTLTRLNFQRIHNELLLHLSTHREKVFSALFFIADKEHVQKGPEHMATILEPRILAFLVFFDTQLLNSTVTLAEKKLALKSLIAVMKLMGAKHITAVRMKVMATLKIALRITKEDFPQICCEAWSAFVRSIELPSLGPMLNQVMATLLGLLKLEPEGVAKIFYFLIVENRENLKDYFHDLYFVPEMTELFEVNTVLRDYTEKPNSQGGFCSLLQHSQNGLIHENLDVRIHALVKLKKLLNSQQSDLHSHLLTRESVDPVISQLLTTLLSGCRETDVRIRLLLAEILGELGAVDPGRLELKTVIPKENQAHLYCSVHEENFAYDLILELVHSFLAADDCRIQDCACYALQEMLLIYDCRDITNNGNNELWNRFSPDVQETLKPYLQSRYIMASDSKQVTYARPICNSKHGSTFKDWIKNWTTDLLGKVQDQSATRVFNACSKILQYCPNVALFLLPQILLYVLQANIKDHTEEAYCEVVGVLKLCEESLQTTSKTPKSDLRHMSAQVIFTSLDHLRQWYKNFGRGTSKESLPHGSKGSAVSDFLERIPQDLLARAAFNCQAHTRAIMYLEIFLQKNPNQTQIHLSFLQKLYAALDEPDGVSGVSAVHKNEPTLKEQILEHETSGQLQDAFVCYERSVKAEPENVAHHQGLLRCLMGLDQAQTALTYSTGLLNESPQWVDEINPYRVEAAWKLGSWDQLGDFIKKDSNSENWGLAVGNLLHFAVETKTPEFYEQLKNLRIQLSGPLSAAAMENGAYQRGYSYLVKLHMLTDIQKSAEEFLGLSDPSEPISSSSSKPFPTVCKILEEWKTRRKLVQSSMRFQEPVLNMQRVSLLLALAHQPDSTSQIQQEMVHCWLQSAKLARSNKHQQRAYSCLLEASSKRMPQLLMERAKLLWDKGDQQQAIATLQKGIQEDYPDFIKLTSNHDKLFCAKSKLLLAQYSEESSIVDSTTLISMYKDVVGIQPNWEEGHFHLAKYYDRILQTIDKADTKGEVVLNIVKHFGTSLQYGCAHIYHSMPRLLALWFDIGSQVAEMEKNNNRMLGSLKQQLDAITKYISQQKNKLPAYYFLTAFPQLISRICHSHPWVFEQLKEIIAHLLLTYPHQAMWIMTAVSKSSYKVRVDRCKEVFCRACSQKPELSKFITESLRFADMLLELCNKQVKETSSFSLNSYMKLLPKFLEDRLVPRILLPLQNQMTCTLPSDSHQPFQHNPFPQNLVYIDGFLDKVEILASLQKPKKVTIRGSDGKLYPMMCKPKDDLRKDCRLMEFNNLVNKYLKKDSETRRRQLHIRTYTVVPLNEECGLIEWVPNLTGLRVILNNIYKEMGIYVSGREIKAHMPQPNTPLERKRIIFREKFLAKHPPVFSQWFFKTFPDPTAWYMAKLSYARTMAVMSMVGYILGLGDRHGENILFDSSCGDTIHVDFNCLFNKGETFDWPERVPFRLTHNMIAALGPLGTEGIFRKACEVTLRVMRNQTDTLMSVLKPFIHDPLMEWDKNIRNSSRSYASSSTGTGEIENEKALSHVRDIEHRLQGIIMKGKKKSQGLPLSIEGQVNYLIQEATNETNLCQMYVGWAAYM